MKLPKLKWPVILLTFAICLAVLCSGYWLWQRNAIRGPLQQQLAAVPGVTSVALDSGRVGLTVRLAAPADVDFPQLAQNVQALIQQNISGRQPSIIWQDQRDQQLSDVRQQLNLVLREAQRTHEYVTMGERVAAALADRPVRYQLGADEQFIYLQLTADDAVWREVLPVIGPGGEAQ